MDWLIFGSINIIIMVILFLFLSRRLHRQYNSEKFMAEVQQEVNAIITELNQTTERNLQLIEDRMEALSALTSQLDRRIIMAKTEEERRTESTGTYNQLQEQRRQIQREMARGQGSLQREPVLQVEPTVTDPASSPEMKAPARDLPLFANSAPETIAAIPGSQPNALFAQNPARRGPDEPVEPHKVIDASVSTEGRKLRSLQGRELMKTQVVDMYKAGIAASLIAQHFEISLGEVELIISLQSGRQP